MLFCNNLFINGSHEQKLKYLPSACSGQSLCGMCMSEPHAGTDVLALSTFARLSADQSSYLLSGTKMWITNGTRDGIETGDAFLVYAKTSVGNKPSNLTAFLVERGMSGFRVGMKIQDKLGNRASNTAELVFDDVPVPINNRIGKVISLGFESLISCRLERRDYV